MVCIVKITIKNEEKSLKQKHLIYDSFTASQDDPLLQDLIRDAKKEFNDDIESVKVTIQLDIE
jgi:hypothetical protein